jgi:hypothetical protein
LSEASRWSSSALSAVHSRILQQSSGRCGPCSAKRVISRAAAARASSDMIACGACLALAGWILPAFCPRDGVGGPGHLAPGRQGGKWENPHESGRSRQRVAEGALDRLPLWPWSRRQFAGADAGGHHPRPHRTRRPAQSGAARACWAPQAPARPRSNIGFTAFAFLPGSTGCPFPNSWTDRGRSRLVPHT